jgi:hypothetical protein
MYKFVNVDVLKNVKNRKINIVTSLRVKIYRPQRNTTC